MGHVGAHAPVAPHASAHPQPPRAPTPTPAQVLCGTPRLLALGRRCGLRLQVHATTSAAASAAVVGDVASAWLERWQGLGPAMQYSVAEEAPKEESFLTRCNYRRAGWGCVHG